MGHFHGSLLCSKAIHIHFHSFIDLDTWRGKYLLMKRGSKAIFSVMLWKYGCYVACCDSGATNTLKELDFLPGAETHVRAMTLLASSLPQEGTIGKGTKHSKWNRGQRRCACIFQKQQPDHVQAFTSMFRSSIPLSLLRAIAVIATRLWQ